MTTIMLVSFGVAIVFACIYAIDRRLTLLAERRRLARLLALARLREQTAPLYPVPMVGEDEYPKGAA